MIVWSKDSCLKLILFLFIELVWHNSIAHSPTNSNQHSRATSAITNTSLLTSQNKKLHPQSVSYFSHLNSKSTLAVFHIGGFNASQGQTQNINIQGLVGDTYTVNQRQVSNILFGLGYYFLGVEDKQWRLFYGIDGYYLAHTSIEGDVIQEQLFTNYTYRYSLTNIPIYLAAKLLIKTSNEQNNISLDLGLGPNVIRTSQYSERSLDDGFTIPDNAFIGETKTVFSATIGAGIQFNHLMPLPCELSYRFFYLGQGTLKKNNNQLLNTLMTGNGYANALIFSIYA